MALILHSKSLTIPSLTLEHLSSVPKRNNDDFLLAYHREQRRFLELYASYGRTEIKSWNTPRADLTHISDLPAATPSKGVDNFVFGTPVLKARVSKLPFNLSATHVERLNGSQLEHAESSKALERRRPLCSKTSRTLTSESTPALHAVATHDKTLPGFKPSKSPKPRKRSPRGDGNIDEEHENRLAERRQRKKMKRDVIKLDITKGGSDEEQVLKKPEKKPTKAQAGFALMHGFSATNVGKNRLTLDPLLLRQNSGVFKKGKASYVTKVFGPDSKQQHSKVYFSESKFLSQKQGDTRPLPRSKSPSACTSPALNIASKKLTRKDHLEPSEIDDQSEKSESPSSGRQKSRTPYNPNDSVIWDIEQESSVRNSDAYSHIRQGTILVDFPKSGNHPHAEVDFTGMDTDPTSVPGKAVVNTLLDSTADRPVSAISLGPSQSASQVGAKEPASYHSSDYFKATARPSKHTLATSFHPISDPSTKEHLDKLSDAIGTLLSHTDNGLDTPSAHIAEQSSVISVHAYEAKVIDGFHDSVLVLNNSVAAHQKYGFDQENSYWSEVNWGGCDDRYTSSTFDISNFSSIRSSVYSVSGIRVAGLKSRTGDQDYSLKGYPMASDYSCSISSHLGMYDDRPPYFSPTYLKGPYSEDILTDTESVRDPPPPNPFPPFCEVFNAEENEAYIDLDAISEGGKEELESYLECSVHSAFEEDGDNVDADNFYQGRTLLYGLNPIFGCGSVSNGLLRVEAEVAGLLKQNHWLPQKL